jgi:hypothetical protein
LAALAAETGLDITVCHFPPGTSKWNRVEHRLSARAPTRRGGMYQRIGVSLDSGLMPSAVQRRHGSPEPAGHRVRVGRGPQRGCTTDRMRRPVTRWVPGSPAVADDG